MNVVRRLWRLNAAERRVVADSLFLLPLVRAGLILLPFSAVQRRCELVLAKTVRPAAPAKLTPQRIVRLVHLVSRAVPGAHCLPRALVAQLLLRRRGFDTELRLGVRKEAGGRLDAHAWLELGGVPLMESVEALKDYSAFPTSFVSPTKGKR